MWQSVLVALAAFSLAQGGLAACPNDAPIDNFSKWPSYTNSLGSAVSGK
jgi:hypothetical protein